MAKKPSSKTKKPLTTTSLINVHTYPLEVEGKRFECGEAVKGISEKVLDSWFKRGLVAAQE